MPEDNGQEMERAPMVGWYDPNQLARTGVDVLISSIFGRHADRRLIEAVSSGPAVYYDYTHAKPIARGVLGATAEQVELAMGPNCALPKEDAGPKRTELWIDAVADVGDGWDSTYGVAYALSRESLTVVDPDKRSHTARRGDLLIFGGDQVYPVASQTEYQKRLVNPYRAAMGENQRFYPDVFAIPGNHDWYDSLASFTRLFCAKRTFAGCQTRQGRSYFALKLPHGWWLLGADVQLGSDIDGPQVQYFQGIADHMQDGDRVILMLAEPHWVYAQKFQKLDPEYNENNLAFLEHRVLSKDGRSKVSVFLAGDLHHYRRHELVTTDPLVPKQHKITSGGGGAFLHPTHGADVDELVSIRDPVRAQTRTARKKDLDRHPPRRPGLVREVFKLMQSYPSPATSRRLAWRNLLFPILNWRFGVVTATLYVFLFWVNLSAIRRPGSRLYEIKSFKEAVERLLRADLVEPLEHVFGMLLVIVAFVLFTDLKARFHRYLAGFLHATVHYVAALLLMFAIARLIIDYGIPIGAPAVELEFGNREIARIWVATGLMFFGGWVVGSFLWGCYLLVMLNLFGAHSNEAFSSLGIRDWKHFIRMHITPDGDLMIYPIGIRRVGRRWARQEGPGSLYQPKDQSAPELIEAPIRVAGPISKPGGMA